MISARLAGAVRDQTRKPSSAAASASSRSARVACGTVPSTLSSAGLITGWPSPGAIRRRHKASDRDNLPFPTHLLFQLQPVATPYTMGYNAQSLAMPSRAGQCQRRSVMADLPKRELGRTGITPNLIVRRSVRRRPFDESMAGRWGIQAGSHPMESG